MAKLPSKTLFTGTVADDDIVHLVDVSDTSADPLGTSFKLEMSKLKAYIGVASFDKVAVFDSSGTPTFYATLTLAIAAISAGGVVHMFADMTEGTIVVNKDMTIVCNGFKIIATLLNTTASNINIYDGQIILDSGSAILTVNTDSVFDLNGTILTNTTGDTMQVIGKVINGTSYGSVNVSVTGELIEHKAFHSGTDPAISSAGLLSRCYGENIGGSAVPSLNIGILATSGFADFCEGVSEFGNAIQIEGNTLLTNSTAKSQSLFYGIYQIPAATGSIKHCTGYTAGSDGISGNRIYNCVGESESTAGISSAEECSESTGIGGGVSGLQAKGGGTVKFLNCTAIGKLSKGVSIDTGTHGVFIGCKIISQADELFGHAVHLSTATAIFTGNGCYFETVNASAEGFESTAASTVVNVSDSSFNIASGVRFASNVDQSEVNLANNLGNRNIL